ncbi:NAD(P)H-dependent oxidoreductase subunit E [Lentimicrobium sp. S6]|uniref:NAD(P)H-dependent oxidoreductase subunit E n=1 Tax=Lentimicrobium sp. S6 TaxID=2735872 RepID=UPI0015554CF3|nr:NAD(P)H-dependent oxidoreductase subunit E [Lentimicrobium sp. S6]NPD45360.1 4Fe-4S binding protein [Lentimicrobium sp. S6]
MKQKVDQIIAEKGRKVEAVIPILQAIQDEYNYLPEEALQHVADNTEITLERIYGISTFYSQFRHEPVGKHMIKVCVGTACHVKGAMQVYDAFKRELNIPEQKETDSDGLFTVDKVACLGCCTIAPVVQIDQTTFGHVEPSKVKEILEDFLSSDVNPATSKLAASLSDANKDGEVRIGLGSCCVASGSSDVKRELEESLQKNQANVDVKEVGCVGICNQVPLLEIHKPNESPTYYTKIKAEEVSEIIRKHFRSKSIWTRWKNDISGIIDQYVLKDIPKSVKRYDSEQVDTPVAEFLDGQINIATEHRGFLQPTDLEEYLKLGGFQAFKKCLKELDQDAIIKSIEKSGLRGRGGGGFPTYRKWEMVKNATDDEKYIICNGDEGDPGAFMDRMLLESYPFRVIEGMMIAAIAVKASSGIFYIRAEYPLAVKRIKEALYLCEKAGLIGNNILDSGIDFPIEVFEGAGAFICGEETALIASVEGNRGLPKMRPPYPAIKGLNQKPTLINNTETFAMVPWIIREGAEKFGEIGTDKSKGTKVFALAGKINRGGLIEVPIGITLREIVERIGGGIPNGKAFKAVQIGGPSGGCIPASMMDTPIDFESLKEAGAMMGSGGLVVLDEDDCMVDIAKYFLSFTQDQSCGKCTFCRIGTTRMLDVLEKITSGKGDMEDLEVLEKLAYSTKKGSLCGLGKSAPNPILSTLKYFREEYLEHINGTCSTGKCHEMIEYFIEEECIGCTKCAQDCPTQAIALKPYEVHVVENEKCIKCDICRQVCPVNAVIIR